MRQSCAPMRKPSTQSVSGPLTAVAAKMPTHRGRGSPPIPRFHSLAHPATGDTTHGRVPLVDEPSWFVRYLGRTVPCAPRSHAKSHSTADQQPRTAAKRGGVTATPVRDIFRTRSKRRRTQTQQELYSDRRVNLPVVPPIADAGTITTGQPHVKSEIHVLGESFARQNMRRSAALRITERHERLLLAIMHHAPTQNIAWATALDDTRSLDGTARRRDVRIDPDVGCGDGGAARATGAVPVKVAVEPWCIACQDVRTGYATTQSPLQSMSPQASHAAPWVVVAEVRPTATAETTFPVKPMNKLSRMLFPSIRKFLFFHPSEDHA